MGGTDLVTRSVPGTLNSLNPGVDMAGGLSNSGLAVEPTLMVQIATSIALPLGSSRATSHREPVLTVLGQ